MHSLQKKYIITGAPGTGKTTTINLLKNTIPCMDEVSRKIILEEQQNNRNGVPWGDINRFSDLVFNVTSQELLTSKAQVCDRSLLDLEAYLVLENKTIPHYLQDFPYQDTYHNTVFFAPTWFDIYCQDGQRLQEFDYCLKLEKVLLEQYKNKGFEIIILPKASPQKRAKFITESIL
ncbi:MULTISPECIES: AAA family ATPase [unclassified Algibacter]|uniref:AAA family ATPase n=1 Tax=unclassified Algibacter TaxID=2615009 RepID=UPI00131C3C6E|nr:MULTISPECIES: ATP-binding protein [unclassified Algibacter]MCL5129205.1 ATP-binding protein [Algibacter sp. L4_22]